eukprot:TRINITY_DN1230_c0_g1_i1.p1 TRINITY_DN1230_c0_g1~~TRINITY_DN1230_c0_g1_i1.p1  ORF type:complete len:1677 (-),score=352.79 TRINITY_DN1230_c0_g1_i1:463-5451(-)
MGTTASTVYPVPRVQDMQAKTGEKRISMDIDLYCELKPGDTIEASQKKPQATVSPNQASGRSHIMLDKPIYRPGTTLRCRVLVINPNTMNQADNFGGVNAWSITGEVVDGNDSKVHSFEFENDNSIFWTTWEIPSNLKCGSYKLKLSSTSPDIACSTYKFQVLDFTNPKLSSQIEFKEDQYAPGDIVTATLLVKKHDEPAHGVLVSCKCTLDDKKCFEGNCKEIEGDEDWAKYKVKYSLPMQINKGVGTLCFMMKDGELFESRSKTVPIDLQSLDIRTFAEGGEFVKGLPSRLYIEAYSPHGKPADDIAGNIVDTTTKKILGRIKTCHEGRGRSDVFKPLNDGHSLELQVHTPITQTIKLAEVKSKGVTLGLTEDICPSSTISVKVASTNPGKFKVCAWRLVHPVGIAEVTFTKQNEEKTVSIEITSEFCDEGVLRVCLSDAETGVPLAERLGYRVPRRSLEIIVEKHGCWAPGKKASLKIHSRLVNEDGTHIPIAASLFVNVTDESIRQLSEKRKLAPSVAPLLFLDAEVDHLEDCEAYLNTNDDESPLKVDLLLGTQGWRRFIDGKKPTDWDEDLKRDAILDTNTSSEEWKEKVGALLAINQNKGEDISTRDDKNNSVGGTIEDRGLLGTQRAGTGAMQHYKRIYAHKGPTGDITGLIANIFQRSDFTETVYWAGVTNTDGNGEATISFDLNESVTTFKVMVDGLAFVSDYCNGVVGSCYKDISSNMKFSFDVQLPAEVSESDLVKIPVVIHTDESILPITVQFIDKCSLLDVDHSKITITEPDQRVFLDGRPTLPKLFNSTESTNFTTGYQDPEMGYDGTLNLGAIATTEDSKTFFDGCQRRFRVKATGLIEKRSSSSLLDSSHSSNKMELDVPLDTRRNTMMANFSLSLSPIGSLAAALKGLTKDPHGCFEQISSVTFPLVMALKYLKSRSNAPAKMIHDIMEQLKKGYYNLTLHEVESGGFEWFGGKIAIESLTAYGLLQFEEMSSIYSVDADMIERARNFLLSRRNQETGEFSGSSFSGYRTVPPHITTAYILYALNAHNDKSASRKKIDFGKEIEYLMNLVREEFKSDPYFLALVSLDLFQCGNLEQSFEIAKTLASMQIQDKLKKSKCGFIDMKHSTTSITNSYGNSLMVETAALAALAWMNFPHEFGSQCSEIMKFLHSRCDDGAFGSTQATILTLEAILVYDQKMKESTIKGTFWVKVTGELNQEKTFNSRESDQVFLESSKIISAIKLGGKNIIECGITEKAAQKEQQLKTRTTGGMKLAKSNKAAIDQKKGSLELKVPLLAEISWRAKQRESDKNENSKRSIPISMDTELLLSTAGDMEEGDVVKMRCNVKNKTNGSTGMVIAIVGIPGGLEACIQGLKELVKNGKIAFYEIKGCELVLYWRGMDIGEEIRVQFDVLVKIPGEYISPASRCYMYYCPEDKFWMDEQKYKIKPLREDIRLIQVQKAIEQARVTQEAENMINVAIETEKKKLAQEIENTRLVEEEIQQRALEKARLTQVLEEIRLKNKAEQEQLAEKERSIQDMKRKISDTERLIQEANQKITEKGKLIQEVERRTTRQERLVQEPARKILPQAKDNRLIHKVAERKTLSKNFDDEIFIQQLEHKIALAIELATNPSSQEEVNRMTQELEHILLLTNASSKSEKKQLKSYQN